MGEKQYDAQCVGQRLTVILRDPTPMHFYDDPPTYRRVTVDLTPEQIEKLSLRYCCSAQSIDWYEEVVRCFIEDDEQEDDAMIDDIRYETAPIRPTGMDVATSWALRMTHVATGLTIEEPCEFPSNKHQARMEARLLAMVAEHEAKERQP